MADSTAHRIARIEAEIAVRQTIALFSDAVGRDDRPAFRSLWADAGVWEIGEPFAARADGIEAITAMLDRLMEGWEFFVQLTHASAVEIGADLQHATARSEIREFARQANQSRSYDNFAIYDDAFVRIDGHWRFSRRSYHYIWLDESPITGRGYKLPPRLGRPVAIEQRLGPTPAPVIDPRSAHAEHARHVDELLTGALADTFPASDPVSSLGTGSDRTSVSRGDQP